MANYRVGLSGCGWVAGEHVRAYQNNPKTDLAALVSHDVDNARRRAAEWGVDVPCFSTMEEMLAKAQPDIVSITTRPDQHVEQAIQAAEAGAQLVLEKPIAMNREELRVLTECVQRKGTKSVVSFVLRWNPLFGMIRSLLDDGGIGELFYGEVDYYHGIGPWYGQFAWNKTRASGGNSLLSAGCHALDALAWFMGARVTEVRAVSTRSNAEAYQAYEYDPTLVTLLTFAKGKVGKVASCIESTAPYMFPIRLFGAEGTIRDNQLYAPQKFPGQTGFATIPTILPDSGDVTHHPFQGEVDHFVDCLERGMDSSVPIDYAAHIMEVCFAAEESAQRGEPVRIGG